MGLSNIARPAVKSDSCGRLSPSLIYPHGNVFSTDSAFLAET